MNKIDNINNHHRCDMTANWSSWPETWLAWGQGPERPRRPPGPYM